VINVIDDLVLVTAVPIEDHHRRGLCLCGTQPGDDGVLIRVVTAPLPPGISCILFDAETKRVHRVGLDPGFDPLTVEAFEQHLDTNTAEWLFLCPNEIAF
jgi:hypothetical protein